MPPRKLALIGLATAVSALGFFFGTGLQPHWWATWLAPLPLLAMADRVGPRPLAAMGFVAWLAGTAGQWDYYLNQLEVPVPMVVGFTVGPALAFGGLLVLYRRSGPLVLATGWVGLEYVVSLVTPHGAFWSLAYTQADVAPIRQLAAATGIWGITFLLMFIPAALARRSFVPAALALVVPFAYALLFTPTLDGPTVQIGQIALPQREDPIPLSTPEGQALLDGYQKAVRADPHHMVVLPEKVFRTDLATITGPMTALAKETGKTIVIGLALTEPDGRANVALAFAGDTVTRYDKHHLIPGIEDDFTPGTEFASVDGYGMTVCKDLDFPALGRALGTAGLVVAPSWDFGRDGWLHSRIAVMRGVESGFSLVRTARTGLLTVSDATGRVLPAGAAVPVTPVTTLYERLSDWFAWLCLLALPAWLWLGGRGPVSGRRHRSA